MNLSTISVLNSNKKRFLLLVLAMLSTTMMVSARLTGDATATAATATTSSMGRFHHRLLGKKSSGGISINTYGGGDDDDEEGSNPFLIVIFVVLSLLGSASAIYKCCNNGSSTLNANNGTGAASSIMVRSIGEINKPTPTSSVGIVFGQNANGNLIVSKIIPGGLFATSPKSQSIKVGQEVLMINTSVAVKMTPKDAADVIQNTVSTVRLITRAPVEIMRVMIAKPTPSAKTGIFFDKTTSGKMIVKRLVPGGLFATKTNLVVGQQVLFVNDTPVQATTTTKQAAGIVGASPQTVSLVVTKNVVDDSTAASATPVSTVSATTTKATPSNLTPYVLPVGSDDSKKEKSVEDTEASDSASAYSA